MEKSYQEKVQRHNKRTGAAKEEKFSIEVQMTKYAPQISFDVWVGWFTWLSILLVKPG